MQLHSIQLGELDLGALADTLSSSEPAGFIDEVFQMAISHKVPSGRVEYAALGPDLWDGRVKIYQNGIWGPSIEAIGQYHSHPTHYLGLILIRADITWQLIQKYPNRYRSIAQADLEARQIIDEQLLWPWVSKWGLLSPINLYEKVCTQHDLLPIRLMQGHAETQGKSQSDVLFVRGCLRLGSPATDVKLGRGSEDMYQPSDPVWQFHNGKMIEISGSQSDFHGKLRLVGYDACNDEVRLGNPLDPSAISDARDSVLEISSGRYAKAALIRSQLEQQAFRTIAEKDYVDLLRGDSKEVHAEIEGLSIAGVPSNALIVAVPYYINGFQSWIRSRNLECAILVTPHGDP